MPIPTIFYNADRKAVDSLQAADAHNNVEIAILTDVAQADRRAGAEMA